MASFDAAVLLALSDDSSSSSSSCSSKDSDSDDETTQNMYEMLYRRAFATLPCKRPKIAGYIDNVVHRYSDEEVRGYAANKACIRDVAGRFGLGETTTFRSIERVMEFLVKVAPTVIIFHDDLRKLATEFEQGKATVSGVPSTIGCIDGSYISIRCPAHKIRSTYINRHIYISLTLQAVCDHEKRFLDVTIGHPSKVHDARIFRTSRLAKKLPLICAPGNYHILGDAAYPLREYLLTPYRDYGTLTESQRTFNAKFSATRVRIENAFADLKGRFWQLLHVDFFLVDKMNKFIIACCVLHNLCIKAGDTDVPPSNDDCTSSDCEWLRAPEDSQNFDAVTATEVLLRRRGEPKRDRVRHAMGL
ncbi:uncharacterized protein LOC135379015 [Ornithodoros turicata]|uniref:uncharacterized protein LOC135379015 n=1 Tax=Ornithodoros turicata TaxID=34597 RepID=UPI0031395782